jgi:hypothetical protein
MTTRYVRGLCAAVLAGPIIVALAGTAGAATGNAAAASAAQLPGGAYSPDCMLWGCTHPPSEIQPGPTH